MTSANNASVFVSDSLSITLGEQNELASGDEVAVFTLDGTCAGVITWTESNTVLAAAGQSEFEPDSTGGFELEEPLTFRVWDASEQIVYEAGGESVEYISCSQVSPCSHDDGLYRTDAFMHLASIDASSPLPVELTSFTARSHGDRAVLEWTTASETNNAGFEVQYWREAPTSDHASWSALDFVEGHGTTSAPKTYRYETGELSAGQYRFRLKQVDYDGAFEYSPTVEVALTPAEPFQLSAPYPNPFQQRATVDLSLAQQQDVRVALYNTLGQQVALLHDGPLAPNTPHQFAIDGAGLPSGLYFVQVRGESFQSTRRVTLVK